ncbi:MAG TPA: potassium transporter Kup [Gammaproteobacteria bacterium]|nr:potassium transporter Kup [Gammaproteobacteria bacterium]
MLGAIGVVYGDIGTSPLYAFRECFNPIYGLQPNPANVFGILSLLFWSLTLVVSVKYAVFIMRADNNGEGGTFALLALVLRHYRASPSRWWLTGLGIAGASMFYGDSMLTPAISVLSAAEGLEIITPLFKPYVLPLTLVVIVGLFLAQKHGTGRLGRLFGPITSVWFLTLAILGLVQIVKFPAVLAALNPGHAVRFLAENSWRSFFILGAVFLCVTGVEALYADMGHFGKKPIRLAWCSLVMPALTLNYFGQGALVLSRPETIANPFYLLAPSWAMPLLVLLATCATVIASQAVIAGAFSLTTQAIKLGYSPRMEIQHTSARNIGQIYLPFINWSLFIFVVLLVLGFGSSSNLAAAYGIAVSGTMVVTSVLSLMLRRRVSRWPRFTITVMIVLLLIDLSFLSANALKVPQGGWFPLVVGAGCFLLMSTWKRGRQIFFRGLSEDGMPMDLLLPALAGDHCPLRVEGTAVFMTGNPNMVPHALLHNLKHNKVLHKRVVLLTLSTAEVPYVDSDKRLSVVELGHGFYRVEAQYGFQERAAVEDVLELCAKHYNMSFNMMETSFFLARATVVPSMRVPGMAAWRERLFAWMFKNASPITNYFEIPPNRVVELGTRVEI